MGFQNSDYAVGGVAPYGIVIGDFNGDGKSDLAVANVCAQSGGENFCNGGVPGSVSILLGNGDGTFQPQASYQTGEYSTYVAVGDFNGDANQDLAVANGQDGTVGILLGNGDGTFQPQVIYHASMWVTAIAVGDLNGDGKLDLAVANFNEGTIGIFLGNGDGIFQNQLEIPIADRTTGIVVGDFNRDGKLDIAVGSTLVDGTGGTISVVLGNGDGTFQSPIEYPVQDEPESIIAADFNRDGNLDLAITNTCGLGGFLCQLPGSVSVLLGNGDGTYQAQQVYETEFEPLGLAAADFNGDGKLDLAAADFSTSTVSLFLGKGDGTFRTQQVIETEIRATPTGLVTGAFDQQGAGSADLVVTDLSNYGGQSVTLMLNQAATHVRLKSAPNPSQRGQVVTFTASVRTAVRGAGTPTGTVTFRRGSARLGSVPLVKGVAQFGDSKFRPGSHEVTATYDGDQNFNRHTSAPLIQVVKP